MYVTNFSNNDYFAYPLKLVVDDTGIGSGHKSQIGILFLTYKLLLSGYFTRLILSLKVADMLKLGFSLFRFIYFRSYKPVRVSPALAFYRFCLFHLNNGFS